MPAPSRIRSSPVGPSISGPTLMNAPLDMDSRFLAQQSHPGPRPVNVRERAMVPVRPRLERGAFRSKGGASAAPDSSAERSALEPARVRPSLDRQFLQAGGGPVRPGPGEDPRGRADAAAGADRAD